MSARKQKKSRQRSAKASEANRAEATRTDGDRDAAADDAVLQGPFPRLVCLAAFAAMLVATPLLPGEAAAEEGVGNPLALGWLAVAALCLAVFAIQKTTKLYWSAALLCVLGLGAWFAVPMLVKWTQLHPRPAVNMTFVYLGAAACVFAGVQLLRDLSIRQRILGVLLALAASLSIFGLYQYNVSIPATTQGYFDASETEKRDILTRYNLDATEGSPDRRHFEDRLRSTEPFATFGLTNSLAGFLAPALVLALAAVAQSENRRRAGSFAALVLIILLCGACLLLTKSRSGYLALLVGCLVFASSYVGRSVSAKRWLAIAGVATGAIAIAIVLATLSGGLDMRVLSESSKSIRYRLEYWQASTTMIADMPLLGCGPGQFQSVYPRYKLPQASETIADPHNFLFEVATTGGLPALLLLLVAIGLAAAGVAARRRNETATEVRSPFGQANKYATMAINLGAGLGVVVALSAGAMTDHVPDGWAFVSLVIGFALVTPLLWRPWELPLAGVAAALATWAIHLLSSGGFGFPGVAVVAWVLGAIVIAETAKREWNPAQTLRIAPLVGVALLVVLGMRYATQPLEARQVLDSRLMGNSVQDVVRLSREAMKLDPLWAEPPARLAGVQHQLWLAANNRKSREAYLEAEAQMLSLDPQTWIRRRQAGHWRLMAWRVRHEKADLDAAIQCYQDALDRYPNSIELLAQLAWAQHLAGRDQEASQLATQALDLNQDHPHDEQRLESLRLFDLNPGPEVLSKKQPAPPLEMAEPVMRRLRKTTGEPAPK